MSILIGLLIIAIGAFCQSSCYVPIRKIRRWSWESYWLLQGVWTLLAQHPAAVWQTIGYGVLWGVGGLTFGLSMRYLGVALGQSIALGTCAGMGTILAPVLTGHAADLTTSVVIGVVVTLLGIAIIGVAGHMKAKARGNTVKEFHFGKGIGVALLAGLMSACFNIGLAKGAELCFDGVNPMFRSLPATMLVTFGGFLTNMVYCLYQNRRNHTFSDYREKGVWANNLLFCALAGALWYSQFFGLSLGKGFLTESPTLMTFAFCILMALNVVFSNVWGIILKEWRGCSRKTIAVLLAGIIILIFSCFLPYWI